jgi:hypothetical protein
MRETGLSDGGIISLLIPKKQQKSECQNRSAKIGLHAWVTLIAAQSATSSKHAL